MGLDKVKYGLDGTIAPTKVELITKGMFFANQTLGIIKIYNRAENWFDYAGVVLYNEKGCSTGAISVCSKEALIGEKYFYIGFSHPFLLTPKVELTRDGIANILLPKINESKSLCGTDAFIFDYNKWETEQRENKEIREFHKNFLTHLEKIKMTEKENPMPENYNPCFHTLQPTEVTITFVGEKDTAQHKESKQRPISQLVEKIYVNHAKKTVTLILKDGRKGTSKCSDADEFDLDTGIMWAYQIATSVSKKDLHAQITKMKKKIVVQS